MQLQRWTSDMLQELYRQDTDETSMQRVDQQARTLQWDQQYYGFNAVAGATLLFCSPFFLVAAAPLLVVIGILQVALASALLYWSGTHWLKARKAVQDIQPAVALRLQASGEHRIPQWRVDITAHHQQVSLRLVRHPVVRLPWTQWHGGDSYDPFGFNTMDVISQEASAAGCEADIDPSTIYSEITFINELYDVHEEDQMEERLGELQHMAQAANEAVQHRLSQMAMAELTARSVQEGLPAVVVRHDILGSRLA